MRFYDYNLSRCAKSGIGEADCRKHWGCGAADSVASCVRTMVRADEAMDREAYESAHP